MSIQEVNNYTVYIHETPSGKKYIGITGQKPEMRWANGKGYTHNEYFDNAIKKYGWSNIEHKIIKTGISKEEAEKMEVEMIAKYKSNERDHGYNISNGGDSIGKHSEESKRKMSERLIGRPSCRKGKHHTLESRRKMSEYHKGLRYNIGVPFTEERKQHLKEHHADVSGKNNPQYGRKWTKEELEIRQSHRVYKVGGKNPTARKICQCLEDGTVVKVWGSISEASKVFCRSSLKNCLRGKYKQHRGFVWKYYEGEKDEN